ncbi:unnamed protein product [Prunus armeniaca]
MYEAKSVREEELALLTEKVKQSSRLSLPVNLRDFIPWLGWVSQINGLDARVEKVAKEFDEFLDSVVDEHMCTPNMKGESCGDNMSVEGYFWWAMTELLRHPRVLKKLQDEVMGIANGKADITEGDLDKFPYLKAVIKETLRLYPPIPLLVPHESTQEAKIKGYDIAARTMVLGQLEETPQSGRRGCPGSLFAMITNEIVLLVHKFDWTLPGGARECTGLVIHRKAPLVATAAPRPFCCVTSKFHNRSPEESIRS